MLPDLLEPQNDTTVFDQREQKVVWSVTETDVTHSLVTSPMRAPHVRRITSQAQLKYSCQLFIHFIVLCLVYQLPRDP